MQKDGLQMDYGSRCESGCEEQARSTTEYGSRCESTEQEKIEDNKAQGFIKLYRSFKSWEWYDDIKTTRVFLHCLLSANHKTVKWRGQLIERGAFVTSLSNFASETGLTVKEIRTSLQRLRSTGEIETKNNNKYSMIVILNFEKYQENGKQKNNVDEEHEQNEGMQGANTGQIKGMQGACEGQAEGMQGATNKNEKNIKNEKNEKKKNFIAKSFFQKLFTLDEEIKQYSSFKDLFIEFLEYKTAIKKQYKTEKSVRNAFLDFVRLSQNDENYARALVDNTIARGWQSIYDLPREQKNSYLQAQEKLKQAKDENYGGF